MTKWDLQQERKTTSTLKTQSVPFTLRADSERKEIGEIMDHLKRVEKQMGEGEIGTAIQSTYLPSYLGTNGQVLKPALASGHWRQASLLMRRAIANPVHYHGFVHILGL